MLRINVQEIETAINKYGDIVITKNDNINISIMSIDEYKKKKFKENLIKDLKSSEKDIENGNTIDADTVFNELRKKYGY